MRLTLRTMLAYMDEILEPADREEISRKIEDSEFARNLMQRIQESVQKARLGAPKVNAKGLGLDANTVAEYLDNTLSGERVPDFERVCLESDVHLAEVAACHQVLTMVLGRPAEIDPAMKRRMYKIAERMSAPPAPATQPVHETPTLAPVHVAAPPAPTEEFIAPPRQRPEVPAYLRERSSRSMWRTVLAAVVLLALLFGAITMALGPLDHRNPILSALGLAKPPEPEVAKDPLDPSGHPNGETNGKNAATNPATDPISSDTPAEPGTGTPVSPMPVETPSTPVPMATPPDATTPPPDATTTPMPHVPVDVPTPMPPVIPAPTPMPSAVESVPPMPTDKIVGGPMLPSSTGVPSLPKEGELPPEPMQPADSGTPSPMDPSTGNPLAPMPGTVPPEPMPPSADLALGRFLPGKGTLLMRLNAESGNWDLVPQGAPLVAGDKLLVLPTFRPTIALTAGLTLQLSSETMLEILPPDGSNIPGVKLYFGRFVAMTTGQPGAQLRLGLGPVKGVVTFVDGDTTLGAEVRRYHPPGVDPEKSEPLVAVDLYDVNGQIEWTPADGTAAKLSAAQRLAIVPHPGDQQQNNASPKWISGETLKEFQVTASEKLAGDLANANVPMMQTLREFANSQRIENRILGAQCLALLNQFDPLIDGLNDDRNKSQWANLIYTARNILARGPTTATKLREAYELRRGQTNGKELYRMLNGYTKEQLNGGGAAELVGYLDHDNLDFRVLAFANLAEITGRPHSYRPEEKNETNRRAGINRWKQELTAGRITPKEPPPPKTP
jgi:hypothetical protein